MYACMCVYMHGYACMCVCMCGYACVCARVRVHVGVNACVCMHACLCACVGVHVGVHTYACPRACAHVRVCMRVPAPMQRGTGGIAGQDAAAGELLRAAGSGPSSASPPSPPGPSPPADPDPTGDAGQKAQSPPAAGTHRLRVHARGTGQQAGAVLSAGLLPCCPRFGAAWRCLGRSVCPDGHRLRFCSPASLLLRDTCDHPRPGSARQQLILLSSQIPLLFALGGRKPFHRRCYLGNAE